MRITLFLLLYIVSFSAYSQIKLPKLISDGMVLQRQTTTNLWGWAAPGEKVTLTFNKKQFSTTANKDGKWQLQLPPQQAGGPYKMMFVASNQINIRNVLFGDVWLCSGQSNMELPLSRVRYKYADEIQTINNPMIRQFEVPDQYNFKNRNQDLSYGQWITATPEHIMQFSAVAYFFAADLYNEYKVPIGLINSALGGSPAEAWISEEAIKRFPEHFQQAQKFKNDSLIAQIEASDRKTQNTWYTQLNSLDEGIRNNWIDPLLNDADWQEIKLPGYWADESVGAVNGSVWFRKKVQVPKAMVGEPTDILLGRLVDADSVFINGTFVGSTSYQYPPRRYTLPTNLLKEGTNVIVVKIISNSGKGGFVPDKPYELRTAKHVIDLKGTWKYKVGATVQPLAGQTFIRWKPVGLFNAMIAPLTNYNIKGVIWYQGESNTSAPSQYAVLMETLISDWRKQWKQNSLPFLFVQLHNFMEPPTSPTESNWAQLRQAQLNTLSIPNTGMAVAIDLGEWNDIHPLQKKEVGERLALQAKKRVYGNTTIVASGPLYQTMQQKENKLVITFSNADGGLTTSNKRDLKHFAIAGKDNKFVWAKATISGNKVIVWNDNIMDPIAVRYAWADNPEGANLTNKNQLPASPFEAYLKNK